MPFFAIMLSSRPFCRSLGIGLPAFRSATRASCRRAFALATLLSAAGPVLPCTRYCGCCSLPSLPRWRTGGIGRPAFRSASRASWRKALTLSILVCLLTGLSGRGGPGGARPAREARFDPALLDPALFPEDPFFPSAPAVTLLTESIGRKPPFFRLLGMVLPARRSSDLAFLRNR